MKDENTKKHPTCLNCGESITYGRTDKVFCCVECKNAYHNHNNQDARLIRNRIYNGLNDNRDLLRKLFRAGITTISISEAATMGFNTAFFTGFTRVRGRHIYHCFEYSYWLTSTHLRNIQLDKSR